MKRVQKALSFVLAALLALGSLVSCSGSGSATSVASQAKSASGGGQGKTELTFFYPINVGGTLTKIIEKMCSDFTAANPNITIKPVYTGNYDDTVAKIQTAIQGGNPPDVFVNLTTQRYSLVNSKAIAPLDGLISADGADGQKYMKDFLSSFMLDATVDGKIYSIPFQRSTEVLFYNKDAFKEVGLDPEKPPTTWDDLIADAQKLTKRDSSGNVQRYGVGFALNSGSAQWQFTSFALQNSADGKNLMSDNGKTVYFNTPENVEVLQLWMDLQKKYKCMQEGIVQWTDLPGQFLNNQVAMIYHTTGNLTNIKNNAKFKFGVAYLPGKKRLASSIGGGNLYISAGISEERKQAAWKFIKFITDTDRAAEWSIETGYIATRASCYDTDALKKYYASFPQAVVAKNLLQYAKPELSTYNNSEVWRTFNDHIQSAITGESTAADALKQAQSEATQTLEQYQ